MELVSGIRRYSGLQFGNTIYSADVNSSIIEHKDCQVRRIENSHSKRIYDIANDIPIFAYVYAYSKHRSLYEEYIPLWTIKDGKRLKHMGLLKEYFETEKDQGKIESYFDEFLSNFLKQYVKEQNVDNLSITLRFNILTNFVSPTFINECLWSGKYSMSDLEKLQTIITIFKPKLENLEDLKRVFDMTNMPVEWTSKILA